jgi:Na+/melibiose symporter-like transporter
VKLYIYVGFITAAISILIYFIDPRNIETIFALNTLRGYIGAITVPIFWSFIGDADDFGAWKFKRRMSGVYASGNLFALKVSLAIAGTITATILSLTLCSGCASANARDTERHYAADHRHSRSGQHHHITAVPVLLQAGHPDDERNSDRFKS